MVKETKPIICVQGIFDHSVYQYHAGIFHNPIDEYN